MKQKKLLLNLSVYLVLFALMTFSVYASQQPINLGTAGDYVILAKSGISSTGLTSITGDIGVSPIAATAITGFGLILDSSNKFSTSSLVNGKVYAADYKVPTSTKLTQAMGDMQLAYDSAAGRKNPTATELGAGNIDGLTIAPGLYKWGSVVTISKGITLSGGANDVWVFQIAQGLTVGNNAIITLKGGAQAKNIFWQVGGQTTLGTNSVFQGNIIDKTTIVMNSGATLNGRALAQTAVTLIANTITQPSTKKLVTNVNSNSEKNKSIECAEWSVCDAKGVQTQTCTQKNSSVTSIKNQSCVPVQMNVTIQNNTKPLDTQKIDLDSTEQKVKQDKIVASPTIVQNKPSKGNCMVNWISSFFRRN